MGRTDIPLLCWVTKFVIIFLSTYWELWFLLMHLIVIAYNIMIKRRVGDWSAHPYLWAKHLTIIMLNSERLYTENYAFGESNGNPLQYSCLGNTMDRGAWWTTVHGVAKSWTWLSGFTFTWLSGFTFTFHFHQLEKTMATHSSILAWRIPGTEEPGGLLSMGSNRVGHYWLDLAAAAAAAQ